MCLVSGYTLEISQKAPQMFHANHYLFFTKACITNMIVKELNSEAQAKISLQFITLRKLIRKAAALTTLNRKA